MSILTQNNNWKPGAEAVKLSPTLVASAEHLGQYLHLFAANYDFGGQADQVYQGLLKLAATLKMCLVTAGQHFQAYQEGFSKGLYVGDLREVPFERMDKAYGTYERLMWVGEEMGKARERACSRTVEKAGHPES